MSGESVGVDESFADVLEQLRVALALGAVLPALPGMRIWVARMSVDQGDWFDLGCYATRAAAWDAVRNWVVRTWLITGSGPWDHDDSWTVTASDAQKAADDAAANAYLAVSSTEEIVRTYFDSTDEDVFEVEEIVVASAPVVGLTVRDVI
jgi:hypothetical protein